MKTRPLNIVARLLGLAGLLLLLLALPWDLVRADPGGPEWVNFRSSNTTFLGQPVPVGALVEAFAPLNVKCGEFTVAAAGRYGDLACFRDDDTTAEKDGADPGEEISFKINGLPATPVPRSLNGTPVSPSTTVTWTQFGDVWEVDLQVAGTPTPPAVVRPVGGYGEPQSALVLLAPWIVLAGLGIGVARKLRSGRF